VAPGEEFLARILDSITDPLVVYDREFRIVLANRALMAIYRLSPSDLFGRKCFEVFQGRREVCGGCHVLEVFRSGEPRVREKEVRLPDGRLRHYEFHAYPVRDERGEVVQAVEHGRDVSDRKRLESQIKTSEGKYRAIVEIAREGIFVADPEARLTFANGRLAGMLGYSLEEIMGRSLLDLTDEGSLDVARAQFARRRAGMADTYELSFRSRDGTALVALVSAAPLMVDDTFLGSVGIVTDVTRLKKVEAELRSAKEFSEKIINNIADNLVVVDPGTHRIVQANASFLDRVGKKPEEVVGQTCHAVMLGRRTPCWEDGIRCPVREAALFVRPAQADKVYPNAAGQERMLQVACYPLVGEKGGVELVIRMERDVTEKRRMEEALAFRSRELEKAQRQLESLFETSRRLGAEISLGGLLHALHDFLEGIFPDSEPLFLILSPEGDGIMPLEECRPEVAEPLRRLRGRLRDGGLLCDFARRIRAAPEPRVVTSGDAGALHPLLAAASGLYANWFGLPILVQRECAGFFLLGARAPTDFQAEDLRFVQALFSQIGGHLRNLVLHEWELSRLRREPVERISYGELIGQSKKMREIYDLIDLVAGSDATVLITGENGTGKELAARAIHRQNRRRKGPFVVANCSAYSPTLLESELFGHEKGAFTGAIRQRKGRIDRAQGGTLFLDEIGDISLATQVLLLRFLQDRRFERVGGEQTIEADVRVLAATNRDLRKEVEAGRFREDLYYRLNVFSIAMPPLRERREDIPLLARHFLDRFAAKEGKAVREIAPDAMRALMDYHWPGNVRQLENAMSYAVILCQGDTVACRHLPSFLRESGGAGGELPLRETERRAILRALEETNWNKHEAARRLGVSRSTLYSKIRRHGLGGGGTDA